MINNVSLNNFNLRASVGFENGAERVLKQIKPEHFTETVDHFNKASKIKIPLQEGLGCLTRLANSDGYFLNIIDEINSKPVADYLISSTGEIMKEFRNDGKAIKGAIMKETTELNQNFAPVHKFFANA